MKTQIETKSLLAALNCTAIKDIRFYLQGVYVNFKTPERFICSGTDGHMLFVGLGQIDNLYNDDLSGLSLIIPNEIIKKLNKKKGYVHFETLGDNRYILDNQIFTAIDGKFPQISRVIPETLNDSEIAVSSYNPEYLARAQKALNTYYQNKSTITYPIFQRGNASGIMHAGSNECQIVIMPINTTIYNKTIGKVQPFNRDFL